MCLREGEGKKWDRTCPSLIPSIHGVPWIFIVSVKLLSLCLEQQAGVSKGRQEPLSMLHMGSSPVTGVWCSSNLPLLHVHKPQWLIMPLSKLVFFLSTSSISNPIFRNYPHFSSTQLQFPPILYSGKLKGAASSRYLLHRNQTFAIQRSMGIAAQWFTAHWNSSLLRKRRNMDRLKWFSWLKGGW